MTLLYLIFSMPFRIFQVFDGFDFTDLEDFMPSLSLFIGSITATYIGFSETKRVSPALMGCLVLLSLWPLLPNMGLYFLARELQPFGVPWPQVMVDDPRNWLSHASPKYDAIHSIVSYLEAFSGAWMVVALMLYVAVKSRLTSNQKKLFLSLNMLSLMVFVLDPGNLYAWWLD